MPGRFYAHTFPKNPLPKYTGRGGGCVRVSLRLPLSTTHQIVREMYDFTQKEIDNISGSIRWIFILFSGFVGNITLHHLLKFQINLANSLLKLGVTAIRLHVKRASQFCHLLGEVAQLILLRLLQFQLFWAKFLATHSLKNGLQISFFKN